MHPLIVETLTSHSIDPITAAPSEFNPAVLNISIPGAHAIPIWQSLRSHFPTTGVWPIIRGEGGKIEEFPFDPAEILKSVPTGPTEKLLAFRLADRIGSYSELIPDLPESLDAVTLAAKVDASGVMSFSRTSSITKPWPSTPPSREFSLHSIMNHRKKAPHESVQLALISLTHPWEAPAHLGFGGWNDAPLPEIQTAMLREWHRFHGAVPVAITGDVLECFVERSPQTESESMALATDQWLFCDDIVSQGTQSIRNLALELYNSPHWFFWWD